MEIQFTLDEVKERYVRSLESRLEAYRARTWTIFAIGVLFGYLTGLMTAIKIIQ